jgi:hypothetical protein
MPDAFNGGCTWGAMRYSPSAPARTMGHCHCRDCQQATGSAYVPAAVVKVSDCELEEDDPAWFERTANRSRGMPEKR